MPAAPRRPRLLSPGHRVVNRLGGGRLHAERRRVAQREIPVVVRREAWG